MKILILKVFFGFIAILGSFCLTLYICVDFSRITSFIYLESCGAKILKQEYWDGENMFSTVKIKKNNTFYEMTLKTNFSNLIKDPIYVRQVENNVVVEIIFDSVSDSQFEKNFPLTYYPILNYKLGMTLDRSGTNKLFPFKVHNINEMFESIYKIDSAIKSIPAYPDIIQMDLGNKQTGFFSRAYLNQENTVIENMIKNIKSKIMDGKSNIK